MAKNETHQAQRRLYPIPEAARLLGIGRSTLYVLISEGHLQAVHIGRRRLVLAKSINDFIDALRKEAA